MISRWLNFLLTVLGIWLIANYFSSLERQEFWAPFLVVLLGWAICEIYARLKGKVSYDNYRSIISFVFLIPYLFGLFLLNSQEVKDIHPLLSGFWFYSISVFPLLVEKNTSVTDKKKEDQSL